MRLQEAKKRWTPNYSTNKIPSAPAHKRHWT